MSLIPSVEQLIAQYGDWYPPQIRQKYQIEEWESTKSVPSTKPSADIAWEPDYAKFMARTKGWNRPVPSTSLPDGWPQKVNGPMDWDGRSFSGEGDYVYELSEAQKLEIREALARFKDRGFDMFEANSTTFTLPRLQYALEGLSNELHNGKGFVILRGLDSVGITREDKIILYLGMSSYIADERGRQSQDGRMMTHITDVKHASIPRDKVQPVYKNVAQPFHSDMFCDILALFCLDAPTAGGESTVASSWKVYNELAATRPDLIATLARDDWAHQTFGYTPPYFQRPILYFHDGKPIINFSRRMITGNAATPRHPLSPPISEAQAEALDAVHFIAKEHSLKTKVLPGDMRFINNMGVLHAREPWAENDESDRYMLRLWLRNSEKRWAIPDALKADSDATYSPIEGVSDYWQLDPFGTERHRELKKRGENDDVTVDLPPSTKCG